jgi:hypothetical protein
MNIRRLIPMILLVGFFMGVPGNNTGAQERGCLKSDRCEVMTGDCRCNVDGQCVPNTGSTCYEIKECNLDGQWVHYSCHHFTMGYKQCPPADGKSKTSKK